MMTKHSSFKLEKTNAWKNDQFFTPSLTDLPESVPSEKERWSQAEPKNVVGKLSLYSSAVSAENSMKGHSSRNYHNLLS